MIVELCGPPGAGKTTLAQAVTAQLRDRGIAVDLASSYRPAEYSGSGGAVNPARHVCDPVRRLIRPTREVLSSACKLAGESPEATIAKKLIRLLPPRSLLWSFRLRQYIWRFSHVWYKAHDHRDGIIIFDQAFVQVVCSLVLLTTTADDTRVMQALDCVPKPDLLVRVEAPREILKARLIERERRQSRVDRLLEFDLKTNLRSIEVLNRLHGLLRRQGRSAIAVECTDICGLTQAVKRLEHAVVQRAATSALVA